jgi:hypothetical protein
VVFWRWWRRLGLVSPELAPLVSGTGFPLGNLFFDLLFAFLIGVRQLEISFFQKFGLLSYTSKYPVSYFIMTPQTRRCRKCGEAGATADLSCSLYCLCFLSS